MTIDVRKVAASWLVVQGLDEPNALGGERDDAPNADERTRPICSVPHGSRHLQALVIVTRCAALPGSLLSFYAGRTGWRPARNRFTGDHAALALARLDRLFGRYSNPRVACDAGRVRYRPTRLPAACGQESS